LSSGAAERRDALAQRWGVEIERTIETESSLIGYGLRHDHRVVLKVIKRRGDEWQSGEVVRAFAGRGMVRALEHEDGAVLLDRLEPASPLSALAVGGRDGEATSILARVIDAMRPDSPPPTCPTVQDWAAGFAKYRATGDVQIEPELVVHAEGVFLDLCATQRSPRLLHGDLQHYNVVHDAERGWIAIDPKGVIGELEYELGASIRNPAELPSLFTDTNVAVSRLRQLTSALGLDVQRAIAWSYAQAVLSAIWGVEDGYHVDASTPVLVLARGLRPLVG
jgi:streptomycin 6-kinase